MSSVAATSVFSGAAGASFFGGKVKLFTLAPEIKPLVTKRLFTVGLIGICCSTAQYCKRSGADTVSFLVLGLKLPKISFALDLGLESFSIKTSLNSGLFLRPVRCKRIINIIEISNSD